MQDKKNIYLSLGLVILVVLVVVIIGKGGSQIPSGSLTAAPCTLNLPAVVATKNPMSPNDILSNSTLAPSAYVSTVYKGRVAAFLEKITSTDTSNCKKATYSTQVLNLPAGWRVYNWMEYPMTAMNVVLPATKYTTRMFGVVSPYTAVPGNYPFILRTTRLSSTSQPTSDVVDSNLSVTIAQPNTLNPYENPDPYYTGVGQYINNTIAPTVTVPAQTATTALVQWTIPIGFEGFGYLSSYEISKNNQLIASIPAPHPILDQGIARGYSTTLPNQYLVTGLAPNSSNTYTVKTRFAGGLEISTASSTTTPAGSNATNNTLPTAPNAPANNSPQIVPASNSVTFSWGASTGPFQVYKYKVIDVNNNSMVREFQQPDRLSLTKGTISGLANGTSYTFKIVAVDVAGHQSQPSGQFSFTTLN
jgi:hypothetical protein